MMTWYLIHPSCFISTVDYYRMYLLHPGIMQTSIRNSERREQSYLREWPKSHRSFLWHCPAVPTTAYWRESLRAPDTSHSRDASLVASHTPGGVGLRENWVCSGQSGDWGQGPEVEVGRKPSGMAVYSPLEKERHLWVSGGGRGRGSQHTDDICTPLKWTLPTPLKSCNLWGTLITGTMDGFGDSFLL